MATVRRYSDVLIALFVVAIATMLLLPLPTPLLSFLLVVNICFSLLVLLVGLYTPNVLSLLSFPTLLLLTTLFRLSLNVASARLILSQGDAGSVIRAFGTFLLRGEIVVGVIIFAIITIVNFIVIARGASRVSEVAARFALDSLPGKQMAIDSDLRAGMLTVAEAQMRRDELRRESQLYGAMDGAMKFVQGDAIAGIFIIITNIVGGIYLGVSNGQEFSEAIETYTVLTVGDGLVTQIPALLISICAGIVVTRVASAEGATLGADVGAQIFARPGLLAVAGGFLALLGLTSGLPWLPFVSVGLMFIGLAYFLNRKPSMVTSSTMGLNRLSYTSSLALPAPKMAMTAAEGLLVVLSLERSALFRQFEKQRDQYERWLLEFKVDFANETGMTFPDVSVVADDFYGGANYSVLVSGVASDSGRVPLDALFVEASRSSADIFGLQVVSDAQHPLSGAEVVWVRGSAAVRKILDAAQIRYFDFFQLIIFRLGHFLKDHPEEMISIASVHGLLKSAERAYPGLVSEVFSVNFLSVPKLTAALQGLIREGVGLRDFKGILELVSAFCTAQGINLNDESGFELSEFIDFVRVQRRRHMAGQAISCRGTLKVLTMSPELESVFEDAASAPATSPLAIDPSSLENIRRGLEAVVEPLRTRGLLPISVLCRRELRAVVAKFVRGYLPGISVISFEELEPQSQVEHVSVWALAN